MPLIKSHSNYVLKSRHQSIGDGTIWERDITTIGGVNQFAPGQTPIYSSGNFIISVRNEKNETNQYNTAKWEKSTSGDIWTLDTIKDMVSDYDTENDTKIVLKQDYYDFRDFAYYGSLTELFRSSITDVLGRFPGELYFSTDHVYYTQGMEIKEINDDGFAYEVKNPFGIDIFSKQKPVDADPLKYFAGEGYLNYELLSPCEDQKFNFRLSPIKISNDCVPAGGRIDSDTNSTSQETDSTTKEIEIRLYKGDDGRTIYMHNGTFKDGSSIFGYHLRPKHEFIVDFYNNSSAFEKLILNFDSTPRYSSTFSVIHENDLGYYRVFENFVYPTSDGGYNPTTDDSMISRLVKIGEYYDEKFTDNMYRSMTHEAIKNFDWTYTREYEEGDEIEYVAGGKKIQKTIRLFAREFDEIKSYIDGMRFMNTVTYDERNNMPDYFLSDKCEENGWDVKYVIPYGVKMTKDGNEVTRFFVDDLFTNKYKHEYYQNPKEKVSPYTKRNIKDGSENGYFMGCSSQGGGGGFSCWLNQWYGNKIRKPEAIANNNGTDTGNTDVLIDSCETQYKTISVLERGDGTSRITNRVKSYTDESSYTYMDINNEFMRRLVLNSHSIWRHKGTAEGIEMILGMFGLRSSNWIEKSESDRYKYNSPCNTISACSKKPDYEIYEYTSFAKRIEESWDVEHQMYRIDWVNTTKTIVYDNRSESNYVKVGSVGSTGIPYQGIPVSFRDEYEGYGPQQYLLDDNGNPYIDSSGNKVVKRYLYPFFSKNEQLDGNPYYQMDGGWLSKRIVGNTTSSYNFQFDNDNNIVHNKYVPSGSVTANGFIDDNHPLFKETVRSIKRVDTLGELLSIPQNELHDGIICYVGRVENDIAVIDGQIFTIEHEQNGNEILRYIVYTKKEGFVHVGGNYYDETVVVYNREGNQTTYFVDDKFDGYEIKAYIKDDDDFITHSAENPDYTIESFQVITNTLETGTESVKYTNYYILKDVSFSNSIARPGGNDGWTRLKEDDNEYLRINTITNYYEGNNGHGGNMVYDNGHEYFTYFNRIFKYAFDSGLFDTRCYTDGFDWIDGEISNYGFSGLVDHNEAIKQYDTFIKQDSKIHYFGNYKEKIHGDSSEISKIWIYGDSHRYVGNPFSNIYGRSTNISYYMIGTQGSKLSGYQYTGDDVTDQIMNNKRIKIVFNMKCEFDSKDGQSELKYIDDIVMNYLTHLVPSTAIFDVEYKYCNLNYSGC